MDARMGSVGSAPTLHKGRPPVKHEKRGAGTAQFAKITDTGREAGKSRLSKARHLGRAYGSCDTSAWTRKKRDSACVGPHVPDSCSAQPSPS